MTSKLKKKYDRDKRRAVLFDMKIDALCGGCERCGETRSHLLQFHHPYDKDAAVSELIRQRVTPKRLQAEIDKCQVLCSNCHLDFHYRFGYPKRAKSKVNPGTTLPTLKAAVERAKNKLITIDALL